MGARSQPGRAHPPRGPESARIGGEEARRFLRAVRRGAHAGACARPLRIGEVNGLGPDPWDHYQRSGAFTPYTAIVNVTGQPAISLPLFHGDDGMPTGIQLIGPPAREDVLLQLATELERALLGPGGGRPLAAGRDGRLAGAWPSRRARRASTLASLPGARRRPFRGASHGNLEELGLVPGGERRRSRQQLDDLQQPTGDADRDLDDRPPAAERAQRESRRCPGS